MSDNFDPYYRWLSIPPDEQPPHYYRLLGIQAFEDDSDVIESAADRQMNHLRTFQSGKFAEHSQRLLNEIATAKLTLLDRAKRVAYDEKLRALLGDAATPAARAPHAALKPAALTSPPRVEPPPAAAAPPAPPAPPPPVPAPNANLPREIAAPARATSTSTVRRRRSSLPVGAGPAIALVAFALITILGLIAMLVGSGNESPAAIETNLSDEPLPQVTTPTSNDRPREPIRPPIVSEQRPTPPPIDPTWPPSEKLPDDEPGNEPDSEPDDEPDDEPETSEPTTPEAEFPPTAEFPVAANGKLVVPPQDDYKAKQANIKEKFQVDRAETAAEKGALASDLLRAAIGQGDDIVELYATLQLARELAADAARLRLAFDAVDQIENKFDIDGAAMRLATLEEAIAAPVPPQSKTEVLEAGLELAEQYIVADRYDDADEVFAMLIDLGRKANDRQVLAKVTERRRLNTVLSAAFVRVQPAFETLTTKPDDQAANLSAGRFVLFGKREAARGLSHLARGGKDPLALAAAAELADPSEGDEQSAVADAWWNLAASESDPLVKVQMLARAFAWYQRARSNLRGQERRQLDVRLRELQAAGIQPADLFANAGG